MCAGRKDINNILVMNKEKTGVTRHIKGKDYNFKIRKLTPTECNRLQGIPDWYKWDGISDTQHYRMLGNGWQVDTIMHCVSYMPKFDRPIRVWSLFDGMACAATTLKRLNIPVECYISSEIDKNALKAEKMNFPDMVQVGSVTDIGTDALVAKYGVPDVLFGGSPCQSFSYSGKMNGMTTADHREIYHLEDYLECKRAGYAFEGESYLFWEYMRILTELRKHNPNIFFFLENVEMQKKWENCLSDAIGIRGVHINSALVCAQNRRRIYWSNFRVRREGLFGELFTDIPQPEDRGILVKDILEDKVEERYYLSQPTTEKIFSLTPDSILEGYINEET